MAGFTPEQCRAARGLLGWTQGDLGKHGKVAQKTIADFELGNTTPRQSTLQRIRASLEKGDRNGAVVFIDENGEGPGVRLKKRK